MFMSRRIRIGSRHRNKNPATGVTGAGYVGLVAIENPAAVLENSAHGNIACIRTGLIRFRHRKAGTYLSIQQGLQPRLLLIVRAESGDDFHVAGIRRMAVEYFRGQVAASHLLCKIGVLNRIETGSIVAVCQEEVPQALFSCALFQALDDLDLTI